MLRTCAYTLRRMSQSHQQSARAAGQTVQKRGLAAGIEEQKVNMWEAPTQFAKWKTEHLVLTIMAGYGLAYVGVRSYFSGGSPPEEKNAKQEQA